MSVWDTYNRRLDVHGATKRDTAFNREKNALARKMRDSLSYFDVRIDGVPRSIAVANSDNFNEKTIFSLPGETIDCGGLVEWAGNHWLVSELDANNELYTRAKLLQCNYPLRWLDDAEVVREQWCVIEDGTKYLTGEMEDRNFFTSRGDSRVAMTIGKNEHTSKFAREQRFLIDDPDSKHKLAYMLTKPIKIGHIYNGKGIYSFVLQEVVATDDDNMEESIADYYKHFPEERHWRPDPPEGINPGGNREVWL